jgi:hypothetical protein
MQPSQNSDPALPRPSYEGLWGTVLCLQCGFLGLGIDHPEWCSWEVLKARPEVRATALSVVELGERAAVALALAADQGRGPSRHTPVASWIP